jgi:hypothetical protein
LKQERIAFIELLRVNISYFVSAEEWHAALAAQAEVLRGLCLNVGGERRPSS